MKHFAVIGAGMAGLTAAKMMKDGGHQVTVFDKSRGTGGRLATRRTDLGPFDHGAGAAHGAGVTGFDAAMTSLGTAVGREDGWRGAPGMSGLLKPWLEGVNHLPNHEIRRLEGRAMVDATGAMHGPFDAVVVAIPAPQALALTEREELRAVVMAPVWTVLAGWEEGGASISVPEWPFESVEAQFGRPGRWVAHARVAWSHENLEREKVDVAAELMVPLSRSVGRDDVPNYIAAHRWRYARCATPLGQPYLDCGDGVLAGGDWALGELAGHAFASGRAMADAVLRGALSHGSPTG